jgi:hypothetical protein
MEYWSGRLSAELSQFKRLMTAEALTLTKGASSAKQSDERPSL